MTSTRQLETRTIDVPRDWVRILFSGEQYAVEVQGTQQNAGQSDKLRKFAKSVHGVENLPN